MRSKKILESLATEAQIQKAILDWGKMKDIHIERANVIGTPIIKRDGTKAFRKAPNKGMSDLIMSYVVDGKPICVWVEVKKSGGKLRESQKDFRNRVEHFGGEYHIVKSITDMENLISFLQKKYGTVDPSPR